MKAWLLGMRGVSIDQDIVNEFVNDANRFVVIAFFFVVFLIVLVSMVEWNSDEHL